MAEHQVGPHSGCHGLASAGRARDAQGCVARQVGTEALTMRKAMRVMKEQAAEMAQRAAAAAAAAAQERAEADAALGEARTALASERGRVAELQVAPHGLVCGVCEAASCC